MACYTLLQYLRALAPSASCALRHYAMAAEPATSANAVALASRVTVRLEQFRHVLEQDVISLEQLRTLCFRGIPDDAEIRSLCWKILLGYVPLARAHWNDSLRTKRELYAQFKAEFTLDPRSVSREDDHPLSQSPSSHWARYLADQPLEDALGKDIERTCPELSFFQKGAEHYTAIKNVLFVYAKLNAGIGYVQGMNELVAALYYVFVFDESPQFAAHHEADTFFCFTQLMSEIRDNFCSDLDDTSSGVVQRCLALERLLDALHPALASDMRVKGLDARFFAFRWLTLLLCQEFDMPDAQRLWDSLFADPTRFDFLIHFSCAMILHLAPELMANDFAHDLKLLQSYPRSVDFVQIFNLAVAVRDGLYEAPHASGVEHKDASAADRQPEQGTAPHASGPVAESAAPASLAATLQSTTKKLTSSLANAWSGFMTAARR